MDRKIYILMFKRLSGKPTGIGRSVLRRSNALVKDGSPCEILVNEEYIDFDDNVEMLRKTEQVDIRVSIRSMWNDFAFDSITDSREVVDHPPTNEDGYVVIPDKQRPNVFRCYKDGLYVKFKMYHANGKLNFVDYLYPSFIRERREWYDSKGYIRKIEYMDPTHNKPVRVIHLSKKGKCYLSIAKSPTTLGTNQILWFGKNGEFMREFTKEDEMLQYWLENFVFTDQNEHSILISEYGFKFKYLSQIKKDKLSIIYTFHNTHFAAPYVYGSSLRKEHVEFLSNLDKFQAVVFLTKEQREDIIKQFGHAEKMFVIPHHAEKVESDERKREKNTVVCLGRFEPVKNHAHAILAFKKVIKQIPDARLELYGRGSEEQNLKKLIKENNLEENVLIKGFTDHSYEVFERATLSLVPSEYEGICLSLMESMSVGCPVIAYDFKYGPKDIIQDGKNGLVVPKGNIKALAKAIINLLSNEEKQQSLSNEAREITDEFSEERLIKEWNALFNLLEKGSTA